MSTPNPLSVGSTTSKITSSEGFFTMTELSVNDLRKLSVDRMQLDENGLMTGYQRPEIRGKANRIKTFLEEGHGIGTAILVDSRGNIIDGQHRVRGVLMYADEHPEMDTTKPVLFAVVAHGFKPDDLAGLFVSVNSNASKLDIRLADLVSRRRDENPASEFVDILTQNINKLSFGDAIQLPGESGGSVKLASIAEAFAKISTDSAVRRMNPKNIVMAFSNFIKNGIGRQFGWFEEDEAGDPYWMQTLAFSPAGLTSLILAFPVVVEWAKDSGVAPLNGWADADISWAEDISGKTSFGRNRKGGAYFIAENEEGHKAAVGNAVPTYLAGAIAAAMGYEDE